jgi:hypothetical protein
MAKMLYITSSDPQNIEVVNLATVTHFLKLEKQRRPQGQEEIVCPTILFHWGSVWLEWRYKSAKARDRDYESIVNLCNPQALSTGSKSGKPVPSEPIVKA